MGFRDFECFNDALLAKQFWRLLKNHEEMWALQLKGLYFSNCDVLHVQKGSRAFWGWSSLLSGRDMLYKKLLWKLGDYCNINIWSVITLLS